MSRQSGRVSMADVARRAGVSGQTVSRVANASPRVDPVTRDRVERAMAELGYRPHLAARALRTGRSQTVGLVLSTLESVGNSRMLQAVAVAAASRGYALTVVTAKGSAEIVTAYARLQEQGVDGAVVLNEATAIAQDAPMPHDLQLVVVDHPVEEASAPFSVVQSDHAAGARGAVEHLLELGHATVHHLAGPDGSFAARERERGWRTTLTAAGAAVPPVVRGDWTSRSGYRAGAALGPEATAIFAGNDQMALGLLRALAEQGRPAPGVSVVGFDDVVDAADFQPPLTTVRQDFDALGERAVASLVARIEQGAPPASEILPTRLVVRASTAAPSARG